MPNDSLGSSARRLTGRCTGPGPASSFVDSLLAAACGPGPVTLDPVRGEVWLADLGMAAKVRPCLVISVPPGDDERALFTLVPHTTAVCGTRFECSLQVNFLKVGAFDAQGP